MDIVCIPLPSGKWKWVDQVDESVVFDTEDMCLVADAFRLEKTQIVASTSQTSIDANLPVPVQPLPPTNLPPITNPPPII